MAQHLPRIPRRDFLRCAAIGATGLVLGGSRWASAELPQPLAIDEPFHGAVLNRRHGTGVDGGLRIEVRGRAALRDEVRVNGVPAARAGTRFTAPVVLKEAETEIVALSRGSFGSQEHRVRVVWDRYSEPRYRFSIDDNSFFLRDIAQKQYVSLFDCHYLKILKDLHEKYKTRFVLNCYDTTGEDFNLSQFPDRYRGQWEANADWLALSFHAWADSPPRPYQYASPQIVLEHMDKVATEITRFAGPAVYSPPTVIHFGMLQPDVLKPLAQRGVRVLSGFFCRSAAGWDINYLLDDDRSEYLSRHDALKDFDSGIVFSRVDIVCNATPPAQIVPTLTPLAEDPNTAEIMDMFTHEQYFWPFYSAYLPDHAERLDAALRWVSEHGYKPVFFHEGFLGGRA